MPLTRRARQERGRSLSPTPELPERRRRARTVAQQDTQSPYRRPSAQYSATPGPRAQLHDLHIFDSDAQTRRIGGLHVTNGITNQLLHDMIEIIIVVPPTGNWSLRNEHGHSVLRDGNQVLRGNYFIVADCKC